MDFTAKVLGAAGVLVVDHKLRPPLNVAVISRNGGVSAYSVTEVTRGGPIHVEALMVLDAQKPHGPPSPLHIMVVDVRGRGAMATEAPDGVNWVFALDEKASAGKKPSPGQDN